MENDIHVFSFSLRLRCEMKFAWYYALSKVKSFNIRFSCYLLGHSLGHLETSGIRLSHTLCANHEPAIGGWSISQPWYGYGLDGNIRHWVYPETTNIAIQKRFP